VTGVQEIETMPQTPLRDVQGPAGRLEALLETPSPRHGDTPRAAVAFAHPHPQQGGTMNTKAVYRATKALASIGCVVLRFNFRGVGASEGTWDDGVGELADYEAALDYMAARYPDVELWAAGFSFGAWVALTTGATDERVSLLLGIAPAIDAYDFSAVKVSTKPKFFIHGERDELIPLKRMYEFYAQLPEPKELVVIDAADHLFDGKVLEVGDAVEELLADYQTPRH
jgi:alpha/beta superfamily hydrolase